MTLERRKKIRGQAVRPKPPSRGKVRAFRLGEGLPTITKMREEIADMTDVLMGREDPPLDAGYLTLMEVADAYFARASEITMLIQQAETNGTVLKSSNYYKFRTGELRTFTEMCKRASDLGSRRLTQAQMQQTASLHGRDSKYDER